MPVPRQEMKGDVNVAELPMQSTSYKFQRMVYPGDNQLGAALPTRIGESVPIPRYPEITTTTIKQKTQRKINDTGPRNRLSTWRRKSTIDYGTWNVRSIN